MTKKAKIYYVSMDDFWRKEEKLAWLREHPLKSIRFELITPDKKNNWINLSENDWDELLPLLDKDVKSGKSEDAVFKLFSSGIKSQRDEWVYDFDRINLEDKMRFFVATYQSTFDDKNFSDKMKIKWDRELSNYLRRGIEKHFEPEKIVENLYRPFIKRQFYFDRHFNGMTYQWADIYNKNNQKIIAFNVGSLSTDVLVSNTILDLALLKFGNGITQCLPLYRYDSNGERHDNITDWALEQFRTHYKDKKISKTDIFHYVYAVLHDPEYRKKYELNLKREFPRVPFYDDFRRWARWGKELMDLHIGYETVKPYKLYIADSGLQIDKPRPKLKADKENGVIILDEETRLEGVPAATWEYKLGNRSAIEWILDQYKEKKPSDKTIAEKFNTYRFADYKEHVIDLLKRVCTVSVKTMEIIAEMKD